MDHDAENNPYLPPQQAALPAIEEKGPLLDPRLRGWLAAVLIGVNCLVSFASAFMPEDWYEEKIPNFLVGGTLVLAAVAFLFWFHRCSTNAMVMDRSSRLTSAGWAVGSFLIPFVNWVVPCLVMKDVVNSTFKYRPAPSMFPVVLIWWMAFLTRYISGNWSETNITAAFVWLGSVAVAGVAVFYLIARISRAQVAFRWSDAPEADRPVMVALPATSPGHGPRMLPNAVAAPRQVKIPAKRLVPPPSPRAEAPLPPAEESGT